MRATNPGDVDHGLCKRVYSMLTRRGNGMSDELMFPDTCCAEFSGTDQSENCV